MADDTKKGKARPPQPGTGGSPVTEDWEAAFKAEDYMCSPEAEDAAIPAAPELGDIPLPPREEAAAAKGRPAAARGNRLAALTGWLSVFTRLPDIFRAFLAATTDQMLRWRELVAGRRLLLAGVGLAVLVAGGGALLLGRRPAAPPASAPMEGKAVPVVGEAEHAVLPKEKKTEAAPPAEAVVEPGEAAKGKLRWPLAAFLISAMPEEGERVPVLVTVELTLVAAEGAGGELSADHATRVRDIIYQFFANRPVSDLRRYSIGRGDLKQDLLAWLKKQWPGTTVEAIQVNRYQVG